MINNQNPKLFGTFEFGNLEFVDYWNLVIGYLHSDV